MILGLVGIQIGRLVDEYGCELGGFATGLFAISTIAVAAWGSIKLMAKSMDRLKASSLSLSIAQPLSSLTDRVQAPDQPGIFRVEFLANVFCQGGSFSSLSVQPMPKASRSNGPFRRTVGNLDKQVTGFSKRHGAGPRPLPDGQEERYRPIRVFENPVVLVPEVPECQMRALGDPCA